MENNWIDYLNIVVRLIMILIPTIALIYASGKSLVQALRSGKDIVQAWREFVGTVRGLVDQTSDPLVIAIAHKTGKTPAQVVKLLAGMIDPIIAIMPEEAPHA